MGVVAKEAGRAGVALVLGLVVGMVNTIFVLPKAFDGSEEYWGLLRVLTAWSSIVAPVLMVGGGAVVIWGTSRVARSLKGALHASVILVAVVALAVWFLALEWKGEWMLSQFDAEKSGLLTQNLGLFFLMNALMVTINLIKALLVSVLKGSWTAWVQEVWLKASYLILAVLLLSDFIGLETMVYAYVGTWCVAVFLMLLAALRMKIPVRLSGLKDLNWRYHFKYGGYSALAGGAVTIATNLDFVMVGALLGLSVVPEYTMGFFIGAIVLLPQRALHTVYSGLISSKMKEARDEVVPLIRQTSRVNILLAVTMFVGIWAGLDPLVSALPVAYKNISGIVLAIGLQKVIFSMSYASSQVISFTKHFRLNLPINIGLVIMTALLNWLFMSYFGWGVTGAALATLFTGAWNASWHLGVMYRKVGMHAFSWSWLAIILAGAAIGIPFKWIATGWLGHGYLEALIQGGAASLALMLFAYFTGLFPELRTAVQIHIWGRFK